jgi:flavin-dependent dehydrogenase
VGGGPAGSAAAQRLVSAGADVLVLDKDSFPRHKLCAGWITPQVIEDTGLEIGSYPFGFLSFRRIQWHLFGVKLPLPCVQHSIRRFEFDAWLLRRCGAEFLQHTVREIRGDADGYVLDGAFRCRYLIGAAGTACPVRRSLFADVSPRNRELQTATLELEFPCEWRDPDCHLWFFEHGLPGYSWYVPKASGWLNVGVGAIAARMKRRGETIREHWDRLAAKLGRQFGIRMPDEPGGYSYYLHSGMNGHSGMSGHGGVDGHGGMDELRVGNAFLCGDSAGLATRDLCEGIGPAIRSGQRAAQAIVSGAGYTLDGVVGSSLGGGWVSRSMDWAFARGAGPMRRKSEPLSGASAARGSGPYS